jgi:YfaZ precursor
MLRKIKSIVWASIFSWWLVLPAAAQEDQPATADRATVATAEQRFDQLDADLNGSISREEFGDAVSNAEDAEELFSAADADQNDQISQEEWTNWREQQAEDADDGESQVEVALTNETVEGRFITGAGVVGVDRGSLGLGLFLSTDRDIVGDAELMVPGLLENLTPDFLSLSLGGKAQVALLTDPDDEVFGFLPGAEARLSLPFDTPMFVVASIFYAPDILTFGDADRIVDFNLRYEVQFLRHTTGFVGYRVIDFDREEQESDDTIVNSLQVGLRFAL